MEGGRRLTSTRQREQPEPQIKLLQSERAAPGWKQFLKNVRTTAYWVGRAAGVKRWHAVVKSLLPHNPWIKTEITVFRNTPTQPSHGARPRDLSLCQDRTETIFLSRSSNTGQSRKKNSCSLPKLDSHVNDSLLHPNLTQQHVMIVSSSWSQLWSAFCTPSLRFFSPCHRSILPTVHQWHVLVHWLHESVNE